MNKTFNINLGGYPFSIDEDAFNYIQNYLHKIRDHFADSQGCDEILYDIEVRMAELFQEHLKGKAIIGMKEIDEIVMIMGKPEDFGAQPMDETYTAYDSRSRSKQQSHTSRPKINTGKRLFRDSDDKKVGGVCSGLAAYFGVEDPTWIRLIFLVGLFFGFGIMVYLAFWFIVPEATSSSDKLAMRGEPATINNIAKYVEEELKDLGNRINEWGNEFSDESKKKDKKDTGTSSNRNSFVASGVNTLGTAIGGVVPAIRSVLGPIIRLFGLGLIAVLGLFWIASITGLSMSTEAIRFFGTQSSVLSFIAMAAVIILITVPVVSMIFGLLRTVWGYKVQSSVRWSMWGTWTAAMLYTWFFGMKLFSEYDTVHESVNKLPYNISEPTIKFSRISPEVPRSNIKIGFNINDGKIQNSSVFIYPSQDQNTYVETRVTARGDTDLDAKQNATLAKAQYKVNGNAISIDPSLNVASLKRFRGQDIEYHVYIPVGKIIDIDPTVNYIRSNEYFEWDQIYNHDNIRTWTMTADGLQNKLFKDPNNYSTTIELDKFDKIVARYANSIEFLRGDKNKVVISGNRDWVDNIDTEIRSKTLHIDSESAYRSEKNKIIVYYKEPLELIQVEETHKIDIIDLNQGNLKIISISEEWDSDYLNIDGNVDNLELKLYGAQTVDLDGKAKQLMIKTDESQIEIDAARFIAEEIDWIGYINPEVKSTIHATKSVKHPIGDISVLGNPKLEIFK
jgi:phage shock protein PspC (stress-responsive transcriptional regulator)